MRGVIRWLPLAGLAVIAVVAGFGLFWPKSDSIRSHMIGQALPAFALPAATVGEKGLANTDFADGKPRLLNIFASWCIPCRAESPQLEALKANGVEIYGIAVRDKSDDVAEFLKLYGNPFGRIGADKDMKVQLSLGSSGVPETYIIAGDGTILYQHIGDIRSEHIPDLMARLRAAQ
jgi:cytochrome c biogenesis protein CcmG, thiol:disulfide interchange protein DsbE